MNLRLVPAVMSLLLLYSSLSRADLLKYNFETFSYPGSAQTVPYGMNDAGLHGGEFYNTGVHPGYGYLFNGTAFVDATPLGSLGVQVTDISNSGVVVFNAGGEGYIDDGLTRTSVRVPNSRYTNIEGINSHGIVAGHYALADDHDLHGFVFDGTDFAYIDFPGATMTWHLRVNDSGLITGTYADSSGNTHGFLYTAGAFISIDVPGAENTTIRGINDFGVMAGTFTASGEGHMFLYDGTDFDIVDAPWRGAIFDIDNSNRILGHCWPQGYPGDAIGFMGTPVPLPPAFLLGILGLSVVSARFRRQLRSED